MTFQFKQVSNRKQIFTAKEKATWARQSDYSFGWRKTNEVRSELYL